ncbi:MAG: type II toxin-antitoxin system VapC family toxin [Acidimicrobiales bacterium]
MTGQMAVRVTTIICSIVPPGCDARPGVMGALSVSPTALTPPLRTGVVAALLCSVQRWPSADGLRRRAFQLRVSVSSYDAAYTALAEALDCPLVTRDKRLSRSTGHGARIEAR